MAGDWIKMRTDLYRDPKVCALADLLLSKDGDLSRYVNQMCQRDMTVTRNVTRCAVVGALVSVWGVLRHQGKRDGDDLAVDGVTNAVVDDIADMPGFGDAMEHVGWLISDEDGIVLPKFFRELNAEPVKTSGAERQKKYRERKRESDVTRDVTRDSAGDVTDAVTVTGEERERREEKETPNPPLAGGGAAKPARAARGEHRHFAAFWAAYPRKVAKPAAMAAFDKIDPDDTLFAAMLAALEVQKRSPKWTKDNGEYITHPSTWLNQRRWEDMPPEVGRSASPTMSSNSTPYEPYENFIPKPRPADDR